MRKMFIGLIIIFVLLFVFLLSFVGIQAVFTDKDVYSVSDSINVSWLDLRLFRCTFNPYIEFYKEVNNSWEKLSTNLHYFACVDGKIKSFGMPIDAITCGFFDDVLIQGKSTWDRTLYSMTEDEEFCMQPDGSLIENSFKSYITSFASAGRYKVRFGYAEKIFTIAVIE